MPEAPAAPAAAPGTPPAAVTPPVVTPPATPPAATPPAAPPADGGFKPWGEDWRTRYAGNDTAKLNVLTRYAGVENALDALFSARQRIDSGEVRTPLPANATPEQTTAWRKEHGIPEAPDGYLEKLPDGLVIGESDKEIVKDFVSKLHGVNADPRVVHAAIGWYNQFAEQQAATIGAADQAQKTETEDKLRSSWGNDYRANVNAVNNYISQLPQPAAEALLNARAPDGRAIMNIPEVVSWFAQQARTLNPLALVVPSGAPATGATVDARITEIEKMMRTTPKAYRADEKVQSEYRTLIDAREQMKQRA